MGWTVHAAGTEPDAAVHARRTLGFTEAELELNRHGRLSPRQRARSARLLIISSILGLALGGVWLRDNFVATMTSTAEAVSGAETPPEVVAAGDMLHRNAKLVWGSLLLILVPVLEFILGRRGATTEVAVAEGELRWEGSSAYVGTTEVEFSRLVHGSKLGGRRLRVFYLKLSRQPLSLEVL